MSIAEPTTHLTLAAEAQDLLFRTARTANTFTDEPVSDEQIRDIYDLVKYAPTSMNQQPLRIVLVRGAEARSGMWRPKTRSLPTARTLSAAVTLESIPPDNATTRPFRLVAVR